MNEKEEQILEHVLERVVQNNLAGRPGTPMAELKASIDDALGSLPPLQFEEFSKVLDDTDAAERLVQRAPELIGWNADKIVEWVEEIATKIGAS